MKNIWKWILGILLVLVLVSVGFMGWHAVAGNGYMMSRYADGPSYGAFDRYPGGAWDNDWRGGPMMGGGRYPGGYGFSPFGMLGFMFFGGLFRLLLPLAILGGVAWFAYQQGKKAGLNAASAPVPAPAPEEPTL